MDTPSKKINKGGIQMNLIEESFQTKEEKKKRIRYNYPFVLVSIN